MIKKAGACALAVVLLVQATGSFAEEPAKHPFFEKPFLFGCHRGGAKWRPESTVKTFEELVKLWPEVMLECDVNMTKDRQIVVIHDGAVDRTTDGTGEVGEMTLSEIQALDAGYRWTRDRSETFPYRGQGYRVPTLAEALAVAPNNNWLVELKDQPGIDVELVVSEIEKAGMVDRVLLASFSPALMARARAANPRIARCFNSETRKGLVEALRSDNWSSYKPVDNVFTLNYRRIDQYGITEADFATIQGKNIPVCAYVIDDTDEIQKLLDLGVKSMLTDRPDDFSSAVTSRWH